MNVLDLLLAFLAGCFCFGTGWAMGWRHARSMSLSETAALQRRNHRLRSLLDLRAGIEKKKGGRP